MKVQAFSAIEVQYGLSDFAVSSAMLGLLCWTASLS